MLVAVQAEMRVRPLPRRAARTARPARVLMRVRNPWVRARRRLFGWNVRFMRVSSLRLESSRAKSRTAPRDAGALHRGVDRPLPGYKGTQRSRGRSNGNGPALRPRIGAPSAGAPRDLWKTLVPPDSRSVGSGAGSSIARRPESRGWVMRTREVLAHGRHCGSCGGATHGRALTGPDRRPRRRVGQRGAVAGRHRPQPLAPRVPAALPPGQRLRDGRGAGRTQPVRQGCARVAAAPADRELPVGPAGPRGHPRGHRRPQPQRRRRPGRHLGRLDVRGLDGGHRSPAGRAPDRHQPHDRRTPSRGRRPAEPPVHVRHVRRRRQQPVRARGGRGGGRAAGPQLQPPGHLRRVRAGQDAPAARHRPLHPDPLLGHPRALCLQRGVHQRVHQLDPRRRGPAVPAPLPRRRRAAGRRHPVPVGQGADPGGVLPHLQHAAQREQADRDHLRHGAHASSRTSRTACVPGSGGA